MTPTRTSAPAASPPSPERRPPRSRTRQREASLQEEGSSSAPAGLQQHHPPRPGSALAAAEVALRVQPPHPREADSNSAAGLPRTLPPRIRQPAKEQGEGSRCRGPRGPVSSSGRARIARQSRPRNQRPRPSRPDSPSALPPLQRQPPRPSPSHSERPRLPATTLALRRARTTTTLRSTASS